MRPTGIGAILLFTVLPVLGSAKAVLALSVGDKAPDFTLPATTQEKWSLSEAIGRKNIVLFGFVGAFTPT